MANFSTPDLCDDYPETLKVLNPIFNNYGGQSDFYGEVVTIKCYEDNSLLQKLKSFYYPIQARLKMSFLQAPALLWLNRQRY